MHGFNAEVYMKIDIRDITKFPNILTVIRIMLIPLFIIIFLWANGNIELNLKHFNKQNGYIIAAAIMILSGLTDMADGLIARKLNMRSGPLPTSSPKLLWWCA